jgi:hypothetical protein
MGQPASINVNFTRGLMLGFDQAWMAVNATCDGEAVSDELRPLLLAVYTQCLSQPITVSDLKKSLENLLVYLGGAGRTNANCWAVDLFFVTLKGGNGTGLSSLFPMDTMMSSRTWEAHCTTQSKPLM